MPFFDTKPFVRALAIVPKRRAHKVAGAIAKGIEPSGRRLSWAKLSLRGKSNALKQRKSNRGEGQGDDSRARLHSEVGVVRRVSSEPCLAAMPLEVVEARKEEPADSREATTHLEMHHAEGLRRWSVAEYDTPSTDHADYPWHGPSSEYSEESDSDETAVPTDGCVTPAGTLSRSNSYKTGKVADVDDSSPFNVNSASPERTAVDPYGVRLVPKTRRVTGFESRRYDEVLALPSFRPVHPAMMFDDEGF